MEKLFKFILALSLLALILGCRHNKSLLTAGEKRHSIVQRLSGSPYSASQIPDTLFVVDEARFTPDQLLVETLQGVLAQKKPAIYRRIAGGCTRWLADLEENYGVTLNHSYEGNFRGLLQHFRSWISGYFLCDLRDVSVNVAFSLCGIRQAVAVTPNLRATLDSLGIPFLEDVCGKTMDNLLLNLGDSFNKRVVVFQNPEKSLNLNDYAIFYCDFADYSGGHGAIDWINGKPVICGRYNLWKGFETPLTLTEKLNQLPRDVHSPRGYSLIPVHVWSNGVEQVLDCVHHLSDDIQVVTPDVFVNRIVKYLKSESAP